MLKEDIMRRYIWIALLVIFVCLVVGVCKVKFEYRENMVDSVDLPKDDWSGAYVYKSIKSTGGTLTVKMTPVQGEEKNLGTITLHSFTTKSGETVPEQVWIIRDKLPDNKLYGTNACSHIILTKTMDTDPESGLNVINVILGGLNNESINLDEFLEQDGCCGVSMDTWVVNKAGDLFKGSDGSKWCKVNSGYKFVKVTDDYIYALKSSDGTNWRCTRPCNSNSQWEKADGVFNNMDMDSNGIIGATANDDIMYSEGTLSALQRPYTEVANEAKMVVMNKTHLYIVNRDDDSIWFRPRSPPAGSWVRMSPEGGIPNVDKIQVSALDVDDNSYWYVVAPGFPNTGQIMTGSINPDTGSFNKATVVPGGLSYLNMDKQYVYGINIIGQIFRCTRPAEGGPGCSDVWQRIPGEATQISSHTTS